MYIIGYTISNLVFTGFSHSLFYMLLFFPFFLCLLALFYWWVSFGAFAAFAELLLAGCWYWCAGIRCFIWIFVLMLNNPRSFGWITLCDAVFCVVFPYVFMTIFFYSLSSMLLLLVDSFLLLLLFVYIPFCVDVAFGLHLLITKRLCVRCAFFLLSTYCLSYYFILFSRCFCWFFSLYLFSLVLDI